MMLHSLRVQITSS